ncbi:hypothetical protein P0W64_14030 [Tsukamurella sp. 8F]|uniref:hypothetical protein n=1 Tax=unclassified Tsukamurella TaxID=2633480 RepID=UPI0023BA0EF3|nr:MULTISPECIES: hypothetical protein [unclassified Tsukamurella]MDF0530692.1 hypothetical protein [Tsukamurella sp. 8J]MDF0587893.1 hypothetical protein [Tsukamurella sp. 8F]
MHRITRVPLCSPLLCTVAVGLMLAAAPPAAANAASALPAALARAGASTPVIVGGYGDSDGSKFAEAVGAGPGAVRVTYPAGGPGQIGTGTYEQAAEIGGPNTLAAIKGAQGPVTVYAYSQGTEAAAVAARLYEADPTNGQLTLVEYGAPSYPQTGARWNMPVGLPSFPSYGPIVTKDLQNTSTTDVCVAGDSVCSMGNILSNPIATVFYSTPGTYLHYNWYTADNIAPYAAVDPTLLPSSHPTDVTPVGDPTTETRPDGTVVTVQQYSDGSSTRTWVDGSTTYLAVDTGQNPWGQMLRSYGFDVPLSFDKALSAAVPVPQPGEPTYSTGLGGTVENPTVVGIQEQVAPGSIGKQPGGAASSGAAGADATGSGSDTNALAASAATQSGAATPATTERAPSATRTTGGTLSTVVGDVIAAATGSGRDASEQSGESKGASGAGGSSSTGGRSSEGSGSGSNRTGSAQGSAGSSGKTEAGDKDAGSGASGSGASTSKDAAGSAAGGTDSGSGDSASGGGGDAGGATGGGAGPDAS